MSIISKYWVMAIGEKSRKIKIYLDGIDEIEFTIA